MAGALAGGFLIFGRVFAAADGTGDGAAFVASKSLSASAIRPSRVETSGAAAAGVALSGAAGGGGASGAGAIGAGDGANAGAGGS